MKPKLFFFQRHITLQRKYFSFQRLSYRYKAFFFSKDVSYRNKNTFPFQKHIKFPRQYYHFTKIKHIATKIRWRAVCKIWLLGSIRKTSRLLRSGEIRLTATQSLGLPRNNNHKCFRTYLQVGLACKWRYFAIDASPCFICSVIYLGTVVMTLSEYDTPLEMKNFLLQCEIFLGRNNVIVAVWSVFQ